MFAPVSTPKPPHALKARKAISYPLALSIFLLCAGCGTLMTRNPSSRNKHPRFYPGLRTNLRFASNPRHFLGYSSRFTWVDHASVWVFNLIDMPISTVVDTVMLPWDIFAYPIIPPVVFLFEEAEPEWEFLTIYGKEMPGVFTINVPSELTMASVNSRPNGRRGRDYRMRYRGDEPILNLVHPEIVWVAGERSRPPK